jgi:hypothetical protein
MLCNKPFCVICYFCCRIDEIDGTEVEETQTEKVKWKVKRDREQIPKKVRFSWLGAQTALGGCESMRDPVCLTVFAVRASYLGQETQSSSSNFLALTIRWRMCQYCNKISFPVPEMDYKLFPKSFFPVNLDVKFKV